MLRKNFHRGSAILIALVVVGSLVPIATGIVSLSASLSQNSRRVIDTKISETVLKNAVEEVMKLLKDPSGTGDIANYWVNVTDNERHDDLSGFNETAIERKKIYYTVIKTEDVGPRKVYRITSYYGGIKHAYDVTYTSQQENELSSQMTFMRGKPLNIISFGGADPTTYTPPGNYAYDQDKKLFYSWDNPLGDFKINRGHVKAFDLSNPAKPVTVAGEGETDHIMGSVFGAANGVLFTQHPSDGGENSMGTMSSYAVTYQHGRDNIAQISQDESTNPVPSYSGYVAAENLGNYVYTLYYTCQSATISCITNTTDRVTDYISVYDKNTLQGASIDGFTVAGTAYERNKDSIDKNLKNFHVYKIKGTPYGLISAGARGFGIVKLDMSESKQTRRSASFYPITNKIVYDAVYKNDYIYLATGSGGIVSIYAPDLLPNMSSLQTLCDDGNLQFRTLANDDKDYLFTANYSKATNLLTHGIYAFNISAGPAYRLGSPGSCTVPNITSRGGEWISKLYYDKFSGQGILIAATASEEAFITYDADKIINDSNNSLLAHAPVIGPLYDLASDDNVSDGNLYVSSSTGIQAINFISQDISGRKVILPRVYKQYYNYQRDTNSNYLTAVSSKISVYHSGSNDYLYSITGKTSTNCQMQIFDINGENISPIGSSVGLTIQGTPKQVLAKSGVLYILTDQSLSRYDLSTNPVSPVLLKTTTNIQGTFRFLIKDDQIYSIADRKAVIFDSNLTPQIITLTFDPKDIAYFSNTFYFASYDTNSRSMFKSQDLTSFQQISNGFPNIDEANLIGPGALVVDPIPDNNGINWVYIACNAVIDRIASDDNTTVNFYASSGDTTYSRADVTVRSTRMIANKQGVFSAVESSYASPLLQMLVRYQGSGVGEPTNQVTFKRLY